MANGNPRKDYLRNRKSTARRPLSGYLDDPIKEKPNNINKKKKKKKKKKHLLKKRTRKMLKRNSFKIFLAAYALILIILGLIFLGYTENCLKQYEESQSIYEAEKFFNNFSAELSAGQFPAEINLAEFVGPFDSEESVKEMFLSSALQGTLSFRKAPDSYNTEEPVYQILAGEKPIVEYSYTAVNERPLFAILTIMDWQLVSVQPCMPFGSNDVIINTPGNYTVTVNGVTLDDSYISGESSSDDIFQYASEYIDISAKKEYKIEGLKFEPEVKIYDESGNEVEYTVNGNVLSVDYVSTDDVPTDVYNTSLDLAKTWSLFMSADLSGANYGLATVQGIVVKDSYYYNLAKEYATGVDITFTSAHTLGEFTEVVVDDYIKYSDICYSCHIHFIKNMTLTRTGELATDEVDSTYMFIYYDDSDDGVDNPHWVIVDMIASTY